MTDDDVPELRCPQTVLHLIVLHGVSFIACPFAGLSASTQSYLFVAPFMSVCDAGGRGKRRSSESVQCTVAVVKGTSGWLFVELCRTWRLRLFRYFFAVVSMAISKVHWTALADLRTRLLSSCCSQSKLELSGDIAEGSPAEQAILLAKQMGVKFAVQAQVRTLVEFVCVCVRVLSTFHLNRVLTRFRSSCGTIHACSSLTVPCFLRTGPGRESPTSESSLPGLYLCAGK